MRTVKQYMEILSHFPGLPIIGLSEIHDIEPGQRISCLIEFNEICESTMVMDMLTALGLRSLTILWPKEGKNYECVADLMVGMDLRDPPHIKFFNTDRREHEVNGTHSDQQQQRESIIADNPIAYEPGVFLAYSPTKIGKTELVYGMMPQNAFTAPTTEDRLETGKTSPEELNASYDHENNENRTKYQLNQL